MGTVPFMIHINMAEGPNKKSARDNKHFDW